MISPYLACTQANTMLSIVRTRGGHHRECRLPVGLGGNDQPDVQTNSRMPKAIQASRVSVRSPVSPRAIHILSPDLPQIYHG